MEPERPVLRIVQPDEVREEPIEQPAHAATIPSILPIKEQALFETRAAAVDASVPLNAAHLACAGCHVADQALAFHHQAIASAPAGTFRRDISPGLKSAEATRAWLGTHVGALKKKALETDAATAPYTRAEDLKQAATLSASELHRAVEAAAAAGMKFETRAADVLKDAASSITDAPKQIASVVGNAAVFTDTAVSYWHGTDVLCA